jgi:hypothetical protein
MVRPKRDRVFGNVGVDKSYVGGLEEERAAFKSAITAT